MRRRRRAPCRRRRGPRGELTGSRAGCYLSSPVRFLRQLVALGALACSTWASVVDNPAVCPDELSQHGGDQDHGTPPGAHCCLTAPCRTPTTSPSVAPPAAPVSNVVDALEPAVAVLRSIHAPAPPTPPPTSFDLA